METLVSTVEKGGPAEKAGLEPGDVILRIDGREIDRSTDLPAQVSDMKPGTRARLEIVRKGASKTIDVTIGEMKEVKTASIESGDAAQGRLGLAVRPLDADEARQTGLRGGLVVENATGPAARAGIQAGDLILALNGTSVRSVEELRTLTERAGKRVALLVQRENAKIFVPVDLS